MNGDDTVRVTRWKRYGKDRLYLALPDGTKAGFWDLLTDTAHAESPDHVAAIVTAVENWKAGQNGGTAPPAADPVARIEGADPTAPQPQEPEPPVTGPDRDLLEAIARPMAEQAWLDLGGNRPGAQARQQARAARQAAPVKTLLARALGIHTDERAWRIGARGEELVAAQLSTVVGEDPRWQVIHAIPVGDRGSDIDHLVVGPGGVFTVNSKHHPGAKIWVGGATFLVDGHRQPYVRNSRHEAARAGKLLTAACRFPVHVTGLIVPVNAAEVTVKNASEGVTVLPRRQVAKWLRRLDDTLSHDTVRAIHDAARRSTTWRRP